MPRRFFLSQWVLCAATKLEKKLSRPYAGGVIRFFVEDLSAVEVGQKLTLPSDEAKHAKVLRVRDGEAVELLDGKGYRHSASFSKDGLSITKTNFFERPAKPLVLAMALTQGGSFETILSQATQLGVSRIIPLKSSHAAALGDPKRAQKKFERYSAHLRESCKQSGNPYLPTLDPFTSFDQNLLKSLDDATLFVGALTDDSQPLTKQLGNTNTAVAFVGPEGDFSRAEYELLREARAYFVKLGAHVLRSEVAVDSLLVLLNDRLGRM